MKSLCSVVGPGAQPTLERAIREIKMFIEGWHGRCFLGAQLASTYKVPAMTGPRRDGLK